MNWSFRNWSFIGHWKLVIGVFAALLLTSVVFYLLNNQSEDIINAPKSPDLIEQNLEPEDESFAVLATQLDLDNHTYKLAFKLDNNSNQNKDFYLIPVSNPDQAQFQSIKEGNTKGGTASWNYEADWDFDTEKHKQELIPELAQAYDDIDNNNYTGQPIKLTLTPQTSLTAQSEWGINQQNTSDKLKPVYFLIHGSAGGAKDDLTILNIHSHPQQGENWEVSFTTRGTADLTITPQDQATIDDDEFVSLSCNDEERTPQLLSGDVIYYPDWQCLGEGKVVHYTKKAGRHTLKFQFGEQTDYAYNAVVVWDGSESTDPENGDNWVGGVKPGVDDVATFSDQGNGNCTLTANVNWAGINVTADYSGTIDFNNFDVTTSGDMTFDGTGEVKCGGGTITCSGNFDNKDQGTWTNKFSTVDLTGDGKTLTTKQANPFRALTISNNITLAAATPDNLYVVTNFSVANGKTFTCDANVTLQGAGTLSIIGTLSISAGIDFKWGGTLTVTGLVTGAGRLYASSDLTNTAGSIDVATLYLYRTLTLSGGTYASATVTAENNNAVSVLTLGSAGGQTIVFQGDVTFTASVWTGRDYTLDSNTNNPDIEFQGDVTLAESGAAALTWNKGSGTVTFSGTSTQTYTDSTAAIQVLGDVVHNGSGGTLQLATEMEADDFTGTAGTFDANGQTLDLGGDMDWASGYLFADPAGSTFDVAGNFTANANDLSGATAPWYLNVTGTAVASGAGDVAYSNAESGTEINASAGPWTNSGNNANWRFVLNVPFKLGLGASTPSDTTSWYREDGWKYRKKITIDNTNVDSDLTDFPLYVFVEGTGSGASLASKIQNSGEDLRFTASDGVTTLPHEIESYSESGDNSTAHVWVKVPTINNASTTDIYMYYGNSTAADGQDAANVWDANFQGVWHLEESPDNSVAGHIDSTSNTTNDGTPTGFAGESGSTTDATGKISGADEFDGSDDVVTTSTDTSIKPTGAMTVEMWGKGLSSTASVAGVGTMGNSGSRGYLLGPDDGDKIYFGIAEDSTTLVAAIGTGLSISGTVFEHWVGVYSPSTYVRVYRNGSQANENTTSIPASQYQDNGNSFKIGNRGDGAYDFDGIIDEVRITNDVRTADEIKFEYNNVNEADNELSWGSEGSPSIIKFKGGYTIK